MPIKAIMVQNHVYANPNILTSRIENHFMSLGYDQKSILAAIGYLRSKNLIQVTATVAVNKRIEHRFA